LNDICHTFTPANQFCFETEWEEFLNIEAINEAKALEAKLMPKTVCAQGLAI
jgi:hypothetical protein